MNTLFLALTILLPNFAFGHADPSQGPVTWASWNFALPVMASLMGLSVLYLLASRRRKPPPAQGLCFSLGILVLVVALISPLDPLSDFLASVHMIQHMLIMMAAAPLIVLGAPGSMIPWLLPKSLWRRFPRGKKLYVRSIKLYRFKRPLILWGLYAFVLWVAHLPVLYEAALRDELVHDFQHLAFFLSSFLFWRVVLDPQSAGTLLPGPGLAYLFVASLHGMLLGVFMAFAAEVWYGPYLATAPIYGLSALEDQRLAGYIMWMPAGAAHFVAAILLLRKLLLRLAPEST